MTVEEYQSGSPQGPHVARIKSAVMCWDGKSGIVQSFDDTYVKLAVTLHDGNFVVQLPWLQVAEVVPITTDA